MAYCRDELISNFLTVGDPLAEVLSEAESALEFVQKARFGLIIDHHHRAGRIYPDAPWVNFEIWLLQR